MLQVLFLLSIAQAQVVENPVQKICAEVKQVEHEQSESFVNTSEGVVHVSLVDKNKENFNMRFLEAAHAAFSSHQSLCFTVVPKTVQPMSPWYFSNTKDVIERAMLTSNPKDYLD